MVLKTICSRRLYKEMLDDYEVVTQLPLSWRGLADAHPAGALAFCQKREAGAIPRHRHKLNS